MLYLMKSALIYRIPKTDDGSDPTNTSHWTLYTPTVPVFFGKTSTSAKIFISALVDHVFRWDISGKYFVVGWRNLVQFNLWRHACTLTTKKTSLDVSPGVESTSLKALTSIIILSLNISNGSPRPSWTQKISAEQDSILCQNIDGNWIGPRCGLIKNTVLIWGLKKENFPINSFINLLVFFNSYKVSLAVLLISSSDVSSKLFTQAQCLLVFHLSEWARFNCVETTVLQLNTATEKRKKVLPLITFICVW